MTRVLILGLDGGTDAVIRRPEVHLPNLESMRRDGASATLRSTVPPITSAAWASMLTGWNPGRHGMFDFRVIDTTSYTSLWGAGHSGSFDASPEFVSSSRWRGAAVWDVAGARDVGVLSVPMTYPAWSVDGDMVAGFPLPDYNRNHSTPAEFGDTLPPLLEGTDRMAGMDDCELAELCLVLIRRQIEVVRGWLGGSRELMVAVFQGTDFAQHRLWKYLDRPDHPLAGALIEMYAEIDALVGEARTSLEHDGVVMVVSDHGFGPHPTQFVHTNAVLSAAGLLSARGVGLSTRSAGVLSRMPTARRRLRSLAARLPDRFARELAMRYTGSGRIDWATTRAFRFPLYAPAEGVVVNLRGRQPEGAVEPGDDYETARDEIIAALEPLTAPDGHPVFEWVRRREDVYVGEFLTAAPDVIGLMHPAYKGTSGVDGVFSEVPAAILEQYSGVHAMDGVFLATGSGLRRGVDLGVRNVVDVAPTALALLGRLPADPCDGAVMDEALLKTAKLSASVTSGNRGDADPVYSADEQATLEQSLRALGYLE